MKKLRRWFKRNKEDVVRTYIIVVTVVAILLGISTFNCMRIIEENNLQDHFYTTDLPAEEL